MSVSHVKLWGMYNAAGYDSPYRVHGFCLKIYARSYDQIWCPDGTLPGEEAIGTLVYDEYVGVASFVEYETTTGLPRTFNYCLEFPEPFVAVPSFVYWLSVSADYDRIPVGSDFTEWSVRPFTGANEPYCEVAWWDTWGGVESPWNRVSAALDQPCWSGWNLGFVLYLLAGPGACCFDLQGDCRIVLESDCPGIWMGVDCDPNPCHDIPVLEESWGRLKHCFR